MFGNMSLLKQNRSCEMRRALDTVMSAFVTGSIFAPCHVEWSVRVSAAIARVFVVACARGNVTEMLFCVSCSLQTRTDSVGEGESLRIHTNRRGFEIRTLLRAIPTVLDLPKRSSSRSSQTQIHGQNAVCNGLGHRYMVIVTVSLVLTRTSGVALIQEKTQSNSLYVIVPDRSLRRILTGIFYLGLACMSFSDDDDIPPPGT